jgi:hypothetical protein
MGSRLNVTPMAKALATAGVVEQDGCARQICFARMQHGGRKPALHDGSLKTLQRDGVALANRTAAAALPPHAGNQA